MVEVSIPVTVAGPTSDAGRLSLSCWSQSVSEIVVVADSDPPEPDVLNGGLNVVWPVTPPQVALPSAATAP